MRIKLNNLIFPMIIMGLSLLFTISCNEDDDIISNNDGVGTFTDSRDGTTYKTVKIGAQVWMAENLKYLPSVHGSGTGSATDPYYYVYGYEGRSVADAKETANYTNYGVLYNWPAAMAACPAGWHLPNDNEWRQLFDYLDGIDVAGGKLKETGTTHWLSPNTGATNEAGFTALPGGGNWSGFSQLGETGYWWTSTESTNTAYEWHMRSESSGVGSIDGYGKRLGFSVRCVKD